ncbi:MAG TPA: acetyl-CoA carboxylase biotin carboxylase subunit [candidate division Zixibacteria bacterium]|nr:acetyl-CoA carboxylase biotin carboxylase subunit [candidate division Zixibacteria bacterium]
MFKRILIANRGEIAVRIARACRELDIETVAVYSEADRESLHVKYADYAYPIGPAPSTQSYLCIDRILEVARKSRAEAVHPGYGFLAENAEFARRCTKEGIVFIGPSPDVIEQMGDKVKARQAMKAAGVPVVPGSDGILNSEDEVVKAAEATGYPFMLKAVAGGGGKGLRLVRSRREVSSAYRAVRSEAAASFGDPRLYVEKYIQRPRHIEIQILADRYGRVIHLYDRECSIQRRHQKVIEECPAPGLDDRTRRRIGRIAIQGARAVGYVGAGTLEFLLDQDRNFYFLEMNTRLQVEHAVTERVVGIDMVKAQIEIASGGYLPWRQRHITQTGHAIECRIYAEDAEADFMPCPGKIEGLRLPEGLGVRNDCGVYEGAEVSIYYDPMIAKLIIWGENRIEAILRMRRALREYQVRGIKTNIAFHQWILRHPRFMSGDFNTGFIDEEYRSASKEEVYPHKEIALASAAIAALHREHELALGLLAKGASQPSRWREQGKRTALRSLPAFPGRGWRRR